jgi:hypothetical protein
LDSINEGKWKRFYPIPVLLPLKSYMEKDHERKSHWFDVPPGQAIQGLLARHDNEVGGVYGDGRDAR